MHSSQQQKPSESLQAALRAGVEQLKAGRGEEAWALAQRLMREFPAAAEGYLFATDAALLRQDLLGALACLDTALRGDTDNPRLLLRKAQLQRMARDRAGALDTARAACATIDDDPWQLQTVAKVLSSCNDLAGARKWLLRAREHLPPLPALLYDLALMEFHLNMPDEAETHLEELLAIDPYQPGALHLRSALRAQTSESNHIADIEQRLAEGPQSPQLISRANYALAKEHEDLGNYEQAFECLQRGARSHRTTLRYDVRQEVASHEHIQSIFDSTALQSLQQGYEDEAPLFVIGLPRTGTTLVERLLTAHSEVVSIGEFTDFPLLLGESIQRAAAKGKHQVDPSLEIDFTALGRDYSSAARQLAGDAPRFVDKLPYNFQYCGYVLAALPNARLIHLSRDPLDSCYAIYKTLFFEAYHFSYDLEELADYFISYHRLMEHWQAVLPERICEVRYETLVRDLEGEAHRILEWCGLPWEDAVLDFHRLEAPSLTASAMQVRNPVHTRSIGAWRRAGAGFEPLRRRLAEAGLMPTGEL